MAKKTTSTRKTTAARKSASARKAATRRPPRVSDEMSASVLDGSMKSVITSAFLKNN